MMEGSETMTYDPPRNSRGFPRHIQFGYDERTTTATVRIPSYRSDYSRKIDCWGLAYKNWLSAEHEANPTALELRLPAAGNKQEEAKQRALLKRVSYLQLAARNTMEFRLIVGAEALSLLDEQKLLAVEPGECMHPHGERSPDASEGRDEKDLQSFFFGLGKDKGLRTAKRLYLLGDDFSHMGKKPFVLDREYCADTFMPKPPVSDPYRPKEAERWTPRGYIDLVSFNRHRELSIIELKVNDPKLEVISQVLDYALFAVRFKQHIIDDLTMRAEAQGGTQVGPRVPAEAAHNEVACYVASNVFHHRLVGDHGIIRAYHYEQAGFRISLVRFGGQVLRPA